MLVSICFFSGSGRLVLFLLVKLMFIGKVLVVWSICVMC